MSRAGPALALVLVLGVVTMVLAAGPALAHTSVVSTIPESGQRLAYSPDELILRFSTAVDPTSVRATLQSASGDLVPVQLLNEGSSPADVIGFGIPRLARDTYGLSWTSVGPDGHRVVGEVLFGVGTDPGLAALGGSGGADALDTSATALRWAFHACVALLAGLAVISSSAGVLLSALARRRVLQAMGVTAVVAVLRGLGVFAIRAETLDGLDLVSSRGGGGFLLLGAGLAGAVWVLRRFGPEAPGRRTAMWALIWAIAIATLSGHAPSRPDPFVAITVGSAHVAAAALWTGPLLALLWLTRAPLWQALDPASRRTELAASMRALAPVAGLSLLAVAASGGLLAWRVREVLSGPSQVALLTKAGLVAVVALPLGAWHHRRHGRWASPPRTVRAEAAVLLTVTLIGSLLVGWDPGWRDGDEGARRGTLAAALDGDLADPSACAQLDVGHAACLRASLAQVLEEEGPQAAVDIVEQLLDTDPYVAVNCHQVVHDLGNDAAERITQISTALAVRASLCWSGYHHGVVEARMAAYDDDQLAAVLPSFCGGGEVVPYSFSHYNCLHGLGHGLMLRLDNDLFAALRHCEGQDEAWTVSSCASGAFMENVMADQQGLDVPGAPAPDDLLFPCTQVSDAVASDCYLMQTSTILWRNGGDLADAFAWCDKAPERHQPDCYRSMGRDISARASLDAQQVIDGCRQGSPSLASWCADGAASNAVYEEAGATSANVLCDASPTTWQGRCRESRDVALSVVAAG